MLPVTRRNITIQKCVRPELGVVGDWRHYKASIDHWSFAMPGFWPIYIWETCRGSGPGQTRQRQEGA